MRKLMDRLFAKLFKAMASSEAEIKLSPIDLKSKFVPLKPKATKTNDPKPDPLTVKES